MLENIGVSHMQFLAQDDCSARPRANGGKM